MTSFRAANIRARSLPMYTRFGILWLLFIYGLLGPTAGRIQAAAPFLETFQRTGPVTVSPGSVITINYVANPNGDTISSVEFRFTNPAGGSFYVTSQSPGTARGTLPVDAVGGTYTLSSVTIYPFHVTWPRSLPEYFAADFVVDASGSVNAPTLVSFQRVSPAIVTKGTAVGIAYTAQGNGRTIGTVQFLYRDSAGGAHLLNGSGPTGTASLVPIAVHGTYRLDTVLVYFTDGSSGAWYDRAGLITKIPTGLSGPSSHSLAFSGANFAIDLPPPVIATAPASVTIGAQDRAQLRVNATGTGPLSYQWYRGLSSDTATPVVGATTAALLTPALTETTNYWVRVTDSNGSTDSPAATITISGASPLTVSQTVMGQGYMAGGTVTVTNTISYTGTAPSRIDWTTLLPPGWKYIASGGSESATRPQFNAPDLAEWSWTTVPASPITLVYTLSVPPGATADEVIASIVTSRAAGTDYQTLAKPDPLVLRTALHSTDSNRDRRISLLELTRLIELYNYRNGTIRTGQYHIQEGTEDGFAPGP